jgi:hypothetical protein
VALIRSPAIDSAAIKKRMIILPCVTSNLCDFKNLETLDPEGRIRWPHSDRVLRPGM